MGRPPDPEPPAPCSGIVTGIYTTSTPEACQYIAHDCRANVVVVDTQKQLEKILKVGGKGPWAWGVRLGVLGDLWLAKESPRPHQQPQKVHGTWVTGPLLCAWGPLPREGSCAQGPGGVAQRPDTSHPRGQGPGRVDPGRVSRRLLSQRGLFQRVGAS